MYVGLNCVYVGRDVLRKKLAKSANYTRAAFRRLANAKQSDQPQSDGGARARCVLLGQRSRAECRYEPLVDVRYTVNNRDRGGGYRQQPPSPTEMTEETYTRNRRRKRARIIRMDPRARVWRLRPFRLLVQRTLNDATGSLHGFVKWRPVCDRVREALALCLQTVGVENVNCMRGWLDKVGIIDVYVENMFCMCYDVWSYGIANSAVSREV